MNLSVSLLLTSSVFWRLGRGVVTSTKPFRHSHAGIRDDGSKRSRFRF